MSDRLADIKAALLDEFVGGLPRWASHLWFLIHEHGPTGPLPSEVVAELRWLVAEVERLQARLDDKAACHSERVEELQQAGSALAALRERHAAEVEQAFREGYDEGLDCGHRGCLESSHQQGAWLASQAKAALDRREP